MDCILIIILIIVSCLFVIGLYLLLDCLGDPAFHNITRRASAAMGIGVDGQIYSKFSAGDDIEIGLPEKTIITKHSSFHSHGLVSQNGCVDVDVSVGAVALLISSLHRGGQSFHSQGLCHLGGGSWANDNPTQWASGRPPGANTWSPSPNSGIFDACQCEDSGGLF